MRRLIVCLIFTAALTLAAAPLASQPSMPWTTFSGKMVSDAVFAQVGQCRGTEEEMVVAGFKSGGNLYMMYAAMDGSGRVVFTFDPNPGDVDAKPTHIGYVRVDMETPGMHDIIPPITWEPYKGENLADPVLICPMLFPPQAERT